MAPVVITAPTVHREQGQHYNSTHMSCGGCGRRKLIKDQSYDVVEIYMYSETHCLT